jgi:hypothetical protein
LSVEQKGWIGAFGVQARDLRRAHELLLGFFGHYALSSHHRAENKSAQERVITRGLARRGFS